VLQDHGALGHALRARRAHVVLADHLEHAAARVARDPRRKHERQRGDREHHVAEPVQHLFERTHQVRVHAARARRGEVDRPFPDVPREQREHQDQHEGEPERRHRVEEQRDHAERLVGERVLADRLDDADQDPERERHRQRGDGEQQGVRKDLPDHLEHRPSVRERVAEVALEQRPHPLHVADRERLIEPEVRPDLRQDVGAHARAEHVLSRIAGSEIDDEEDEGGDPEQDRDREQRATK
jgi:hypothetical protein